MKSAGKLALFEETILPHLSAAYNLARWLARNDQDAEDIVQEAYLRVPLFRRVRGRQWKGLAAGSRAQYLSDLEASRERHEQRAI